MLPKLIIFLQQAWRQNIKILFLLQNAVQSVAQVTDFTFYIDLSPFGLDASDENVTYDETSMDSVICVTESVMHDAECCGCHDILLNLTYIMSMDTILCATV